MIDPRTRWGALVLCEEGQVPWLSAQAEALAARVPRVLVVPGARAAGFEFHPDDRARAQPGFEVAPSEELVASARAAVADVEAFEVFERRGPQAEVLNAALEHLGTYEALVLGADELLRDPLELLRFCERAPRAKVFGAALRAFETLDRVRDVPDWTVVACRPGAGFRFEAPRTGQLDQVDLLDDPLGRYGRLLEDGDGADAQHWRNPHPAPALRVAAAAGLCPAPPTRATGEVDVSIVVPFYGEVAVTEACARAVLRAADPAGPTFELILRDDRGPEDLDLTSPILADPRVRLSRAEENLGFLRTVNAAASEARGRYLVLLNNDTEPLPGWLEALVGAAESDAAVGVVAAQLLYPDGSLQEAGGIVYQDASGCNYGKHDDPLRDRYQYRRDVDYGSGAALLVERALWEQLGGFDERFAPAYYEDTDLCFQARAAGRRVVYEPRARVVHLEGHTCGTDEASGVKQHQVTNRERFLEKWGAVLRAEHRPPGSAPHAARERAGGAHVAVIHPSFPMFDRDSGSFRLYHVLKALRAAGRRVSFVSRSFMGNVSHRRALEELGVQTILGRSHLEGDLPTRSCLGPRLIALAQEHPIDVAICGHYQTTRRALRYLRRYSPGTRVVTDSVDVHYRRLQREADLTGDPGKLAEAQRVKRRELAAYRRSDHVIAISEEEAELLRPEVRGVPISVLSNIHPLPGPRPGRGGREGLLFVGSFAHPPNGDAVRYLVQEILPLVWAERPDLCLDVVGGGAAGDVAALASERVRLLGFVDELEPQLDGHVALVAPLRFGAGAKGKVGQALSFGLPVITTAVGAEGMGLARGRHYAHAETPEEFAREILRVAGDGDVWAALAANGVERIREAYSEEAVARKLAAGVLQLEPLAQGWRRTWTKLKGLTS